MAGDIVHLGRAALTSEPPISPRGVAARFESSPSAALHLVAHRAAKRAATALPLPEEASLLLSRVSDQDPSDQNHWTVSHAGSGALVFESRQGPLETQTPGGQEPKTSKIPPALWLEPSGRLGIGGTFPKQALSVRGAVSAAELLLASDDSLLAPGGGVTPLSASAKAAALKLVASGLSVGACRPPVKRPGGDGSAEALARRHLGLSESQVHGEAQSFLCLSGQQAQAAAKAVDSAAAAGGSLASVTHSGTGP